MALFRWLQALAGLSLTDRRHGRPPGRGRLQCMLVLESLVDRIVPSFLPTVNYPVAGYPTHIVAADLEGDGAPDLVTPGQAGVIVLLNNGDGTFQPGVTYAVDQAVSTVAVGDINGDGIPDIIVGGISYPDRINVLLGNGDGTFQQPIDVPVPTAASAIAVADLTGSGHADLVLADGSANQVTILLGNGDGTFQQPVSYAAGSFPRSVVVGDFRGDGHVDIAVADEAGLGGDSGVSVLLGDGDGTFQPAVFYATAAFPSYLALGDFQGNGILDLATASQGGHTVSVLLGNGDGTFQAATQVDAGIGALSLAVTDFNGDGRQDLAVAGFYGTGGEDSGVNVLLGNGDGTFQDPMRYDTDRGSISVVAADFNGDGHPDLAVGNFTAGDISVLINAADWPAPRTPARHLSLAPIAVAAPFLGDPVFTRPVGGPSMEPSPDDSHSDLAGLITAAAPAQSGERVAVREELPGHVPLPITPADHVAALIAFHPPTVDPLELDAVAV